MLLQIKLNLEEVPEVWWDVIFPVIIMILTFGSTRKSLSLWLVFPNWIMLMIFSWDRLYILQLVFYDLLKKEIKPHHQAAALHCDLETTASPNC